MTPQAHGSPPSFEKSTWRETELSLRGAQIAQLFRFLRVEWCTSTEQA